MFWFFLQSVKYRGGGCCCFWCELRKSFSLHSISDIEAVQCSIMSLRKKNHSSQNLFSFLFIQNKHKIIYLGGKWRTITRFITDRCSHFEYVGTFAFMVIFRNFSWIVTYHNFKMRSQQLFGGCHFLDLRGYIQFNFNTPVSLKNGKRRLRNAASSR